MTNAPHVASEPAILYFGTPVVLISTINEDGTANLAPMSSAFWLGWRCVLGLGASSKTVQNLRRTGECVLNLPSTREVAAVDRLAKLTGVDPVPPVKAARGYTHEASKFAIARLTPVASETVAPPRALECPVHLEAVVAAEHALMEDTARPGSLILFEVRVQRVHLHPDVLMAGETNRVDPDKWRPLIMSFQRFYGLADAEVHPSRLGEIPEAMYRSPDVDRARRELPSTLGAD